MRDVYKVEHPRAVLVCMQEFSRYIVHAKVEKSLTKAGWDWYVYRKDKEHPNEAPLKMAGGDLKSQVKAVSQAKESARLIAKEHGYEHDPVVIRPLPPSRQPSVRK